MAIAPQKPTRNAGQTILAPPSQAPSAPSARRKIRAATDTAGSIALRGQKRRRGRQNGAQGKRGRRSEGGEDGVGAPFFGQAKFVAGMGGEGVLRRQLFGDLAGQRGVEAAVLVNPRKFVQFGVRLFLQRALLALEVSGLEIRLRADGDEFARRHRHGACRPSGEGRGQDLAPARRGGGDADDQARRRDEPVVCAEHRGAEPAGAVNKMDFGVRHD
jgi:hypothetical protein